MKKTLLATVVLTAITSQAGAATQEQARTIGEGYQHAVRFNMTDVHNPDTLIDAHKLAHNPLFAGKEVGQKAQALMTHIYDAWAEQKDHLAQKEAPYPQAAPQLEAPYADPIAKPQATPVKAPVAQQQQTPVKAAAPTAQPQFIPTIKQQTPTLAKAPALNPQPNHATPKIQGETPEYARQLLPVVDQETPIIAPSAHEQLTPVKAAAPTAQPHLIPTVQQQTPEYANQPALNPQPNRATPALQQLTPEYAKQLIATPEPTRATPAIQQQTPVKQAAPTAQPQLIPAIQQQTPVKQAVPTAQPHLIPTVQQQIPTLAKAPELNPQPNRATPTIQGETPEYAKQLIATPVANRATPSVIQQTPVKPVAAAPTLHPQQQPTKEQFTPDHIPNEGLTHAIRYDMVDVHNPDSLMDKEKLAHNPLFADKEVGQKASAEVSRLMAIKLEQQGHYEARQAAASQENAPQATSHSSAAAVVLAQPAPATIPNAVSTVVLRVNTNKADIDTNKTDIATNKSGIATNKANITKDHDALIVVGDKVNDEVTNRRDADTQLQQQFDAQKTAQTAVDATQTTNINKAAAAAVKEFNRATAAEQALTDRVDDHENRIATLENAPPPKDGKDGKDGLNGADGKDGAKGDKGDTGATGAAGAAGAAGRDGTNGVDGKDGKDGLNGADGKDGKDGINGTNGVDGKDGLNGTDGKDGKDGKDGHDGAKGDKGDTGAAGKDVDPTVVNQLKDGIKTNGDAVKTNKDAIDQNEANIAATVLKVNANSKGIDTNKQGVSDNAAAIKLHDTHAQTLAQGELTVSRLAVQNNKQIVTNQQALTKQAQDFTALQTEVKQKVDTSVFQQRSAVVDQRFADTDARIHQQKVEQDKTNQKVAANSKQLANHEARITDLEANNKSNFNKLEAQQNKDRKEFRAGVAGAVALTQIPQVQADQSGNFGMAVGTFNGENAIAAGVSTRVTKSVTVKSGLSWDTQGNVGAGAGVAIGW